MEHEKDKIHELTLKLHRLVGVLQGKGIIDGETGEWILKGKL